MADAPVARVGPGDLAGSTYSPQGEHTDIEARIDCANAAHAQLLLSIHFDAYASPDVGGTETTYDPDRQFSDSSHRFASLVQSDVLTRLAAHGWTVPDRGVLVDTGLGAPALTARASAYGHLLELGPAAPGWLAHPSSMPGVLVEPLFVTDPGEAAVAESTQGQQLLAGALTHAVEQYFYR
jgi:N-acetylmuramoyl-L-alanine amidase